jgi:hypothetical protein
MSESQEVEITTNKQSKNLTIALNPLAVVANLSTYAILRNIASAKWVYLYLKLNVWPVWVADNNINMQQKFYSLPKLYSPTKAKGLLLEKRRISMSRTLVVVTCNSVTCIAQTGISRFDIIQHFSNRGMKDLSLKPHHPYRFQHFQYMLDLFRAI